MAQARNWMHSNSWSENIWDLSTSGSTKLHYILLHTIKSAIFHILPIFAGAGARAKHAKLWELEISNQSLTNINRHCCWYSSWNSNGIIPSYNPSYYCQIRLVQDYFASNRTLSLSFAVNLALVCATIAEPLAGWLDVVCAQVSLLWMCLHNTGNTPPVWFPSVCGLHDNMTLYNMHIWFLNLLWNALKLSRSACNWRTHNVLESLALCSKVASCILLLLSAYLGLMWAVAKTLVQISSNPRCLPSCFPRCFLDHSFSFRRWRVSWYLFRGASTKTSCDKFKVEWTSLGRCGECSSRHFRDWMVSLYSSASSSARFRGRGLRFRRPPQLSFVLNFPSWRFLMLLMMCHVSKPENDMQKKASNILLPPVHTGFANPRKMKLSFDSLSWIWSLLNSA